MAICTRTEKKVLFLLKKNLLKFFFSENFYKYIVIGVYTPWWMIPNESSFFWEKQNFLEICFLQCLIFLFYGRSSVLPLTTMSFIKTFSSKNLSIEIFSKCTFQLLSSFFCAPLILYDKLFKRCFREKSFRWKASPLKPNFSFLSSELCTPIHNNVKKVFFRTVTKNKQFFPKLVFLSFSVCTPIEESNITNQNFLGKTNFGEEIFFSRI